MDSYKEWRYMVGKVVYNVFTFKLDKYKTLGISTKIYKQFINSHHDYVHYNSQKKTKMNNDDQPTFNIIQTTNNNKK